MKKLTFDEFEKNKTFILAVTKEQKEKRFEWLKENNYRYLNGLTINKDFICHNGSNDLEAFARGSRSFNNVYTVEQLEWKPKLKYNVGDYIEYAGEKRIIVKVNPNSDICCYYTNVVNEYGEVVSDQSGYGYMKSTIEDAFKPYTPIERPKKKEMTIKEIEDILGYEIKVVK